MNHGSKDIPTTTEAKGKGEQPIGVENASPKEKKKKSLSKGWP